MFSCDPHTTLDECRLPHLVPEALDIARVLANQERLKHLVDAHFDSTHAARQGVQMAHPDDSGASLDLNDEQVDSWKR